ncbi:YihY/virulence factor BrkB family protein [Ornithinimicrobium cerasi]|uniref:YihY/virulence factor BrkB family protein n=1 Tax=Ornithinimicrobium cerasi TaxID=2248773 RepID=UPI00137B24E1|nr:YhjD/YihY/BrkB family envelope integrity protein [Ornithinimicrobium cerasi]
MKTVLLRLEELQQRHPWLGFPVAVVYKFIDDHGVYLSVLITYYGFLALFPLLLLLTSGLGFVLDDQPELRERILETAVSQFPVIGSQLGDEGFGGSTTAVVIGGLVAVWGAIRASQATLHMMNICWAVPRHSRPDPLRSPIRALPLIAVAGLMLLGTTVGTVLATSAGAYGVTLQRAVPYLVVVFSFVVAVLVFSLGMWLGTTFRLRWTQVLPGALVAAVGWLLLQRFGITYANQIVREAGDTYGVFAFVLGLIGFIFVAAQIVVLAVEVNVVRVKKLWPRALLGPFTRSVSLTPADVRAYQETTAATAIKDYQGVEVSFDQHLAGTPVTQRRQAAAAEADAEERSEDEGSGNR